MIRLRDAVRAELRDALESVRSAGPVRARAVGLLGILAALLLATAGAGDAVTLGMGVGGLAVLVVGLFV